MKKVLLVTRPIAPPWDEASKNFAYFLAKNVPEIEFGLLTSETLSDLPDNIRQYPIYSSNKLDFFQKIRLLKIRKLLKDNDFDILHYMLTPNKLNSYSFKHFLTTTKAKTIQTIATLREDLFKDDDFKKILFANLIITYSDYAKNKLNSQGFNNVRRVYPGIDLDLYSPTEKDREMSKLLNIDINDFIVSYPGEFVRLGATDNIVNLIIKYADKLRERKIKIMFPGRLKNSQDLDKRSEVEKILSQNKLLDIAIFPDKLSGLEMRKKADFVSKYYNLAGIIIFPVHDMKGKFDIPLVIPEAMACEKPVILSDLPILTELTNGKNSVIIPRGNIDAMYQAILGLYENKAQREEIGKNAREFVKDNFDIKNIAQIYQKIYETL